MWPFRTGLSEPGNRLTQGMTVDDKRRDRHFLDTFMLVIGLLVLFALFAYWLASAIANSDPGAYNRGSSIQEQLIDQRLAPIGDVQIAGNQASQMTSAAPAGGGAAKAGSQSGKEIWEGTCAACHSSGLLGAPKIGDKAAWAPRLAQGLATLEKHALHGYKQMPAKGGNASLSDAEVIKALEYMISQSGGAKLVHR